MKILCVGGGTLGSVTPLLAIIEEIKKRHPEAVVEWWGTKNGPEKSLIEPTDINFKTIEAGKLRRYFSGQNILDVARIVTGFCQALWYLGSSKPDCVLTAGSFVAVPVAWAAYLYSVPIFVHQQDVRLGLANKLLRPFAKKVTVALPELIKDFPKQGAQLTGNPVRSIFLNPPDSISAKNKLGLDTTRPVVLVMGGGTGAKFFNDLVLESKADLIKLAQVVHVTGVGKEAGETMSGYKVLPLTNESIYLLAAADIVITRAGFGTLTELSALHKPAIVVPIPQSHQEDNAQYFADKEAIIMVRQQELTSHKLLATVSQLLTNKAMCQRLGQKLNEAISIKGAFKIADLVDEQLNQS